MSDAVISYPFYLLTGEMTDDDLIYTPLVEVKDWPDITGTREALDATTTANKVYSNIEGIQGNDTKSFTCNYNKTDYEKINALKGQEQYVAFMFGRNGEYGRFVGRAYVSVAVNGSAVNEIVNMTVTCIMTGGPYEVFDPLLVNWTTNENEDVQTDTGENIKFNYAPIKDVRKIFQNNFARQLFNT
jgi:hypothetical protein